jgi:Fe-S-cluster containining protein
LREDALALLNAEQQRVYLGMVGEDGWCVHYDTGGQRCRIYATRPAFCRVEMIMGLLGAEGTEADGLAIHFCQQQIRSETGGRGKVMRRFQRALRQR